MNKSIMLLASNFPPYDGGRIGASIRVHTMAEFLAKKGFNVHVVIPKRYAKNREVPFYHSNITIHKYFSPFQYFDHAKQLPAYLWIIRKMISAAKKISAYFFLNSVELYLPFIVSFCKKNITGIYNRYNNYKHTASAFNENCFVFEKTDRESIILDCRF